MMSVLKQIEEAGIVGVGGAGFPTHVKYKAKVEYLIINAAECEPLLKTDHYVMRNHAVEVIRAIDIMKQEVEASYAVIATKAYYKEEISVLKKAKAELGSDVSFHLMDNFYPAGDEQVMVYEVTGRVVPAGGIPLMVDCIVSNVATMLNIYQAITNEQAVTTKQLTVTGAVNKPSLLQVPIGTPFIKCLEAVGGSTLAEDFLFIDGGPMMGTLHVKDEIYDRVVTKTTSGLIVIKDDGYLSKLKHQTLQHIFAQTKSSCIQCTLCSEVCPRVMIGHDVVPHKVMRYFGGVANFGDVEDNKALRGALICCECGICDVIACPMGISPRQVNQYVKKEFANMGVRYEGDKEEFIVDCMREYKAVSPKNILLKLGLAQYDKYQLNEVRTVAVNEVFIPLSMHIGAPSAPVVNVGDRVDAGDLIATIPDASLGANIHASISGEVISTSDSKIQIKKAVKCL